MMTNQPILLQGRNGRHGRGFTLIELLIALAILGVLLGLGFPALMEWMVNNQIRNQAEYLRFGLQTARSEAINRNRFTRFQLVSTMDANCIVTPMSNLWVVSHGSPADATQGTDAWADAGGVTQVAADARTRCARDRSVMIPNYLLTPSMADTNPGNNPIIIQKGERESTSTVQSLITVIATPAIAGAVAPAICFNPSGQLARIDTATGTCSESLHPANTAMATAQIDILMPATAGACRTAGGGAGFVCLRIMVSPSGSTRLCDPVAVAPDPRVC